MRKGEYSVAGPLIPLFHSVLFAITLMRKENSISSWDHSLSRVCTFSPCLCRFSLGPPVSSHIPRMCMWGEWRVSIVPSEWVWVGLALWQKGALSRVSPASVPSCQERLWTGISRLENNYVVWLIFPICLYRSHLLQCLIIEMFWVSI